ncbi:uncharacterized protein TRIVIDRAFT_63614 [Trichoderma virens Gv29-8]|uniref:CCHC-type domain-containing protein n=1 Tax=Hypocrea virens (strain Gv29-8 / FGSC 10586) TaxID=413071 RepID=G9MHV8_HYPVG|nr:uncharacterized protein TRIVIDRAFT_63614 [Trichoderma virens Gv29-8]EHK26295.1 hypothetical protein TRIVIDRAFT_63614 [Trichoderma virens Gv29-8]
MATDQSNPGDFISLLSSEDETPLAKKRKSPDDDSASIGGIDASTERSKRARVSSASADSITGAKVSEEGEIDDDEDSEGEVRTPGTGGEEKKTGGFASSGVFVPKSPPAYASDSISLQLPVFSQQREGTWLARFKEWAQLLCTANSPSVTKITPALVRAAYKQYIDIHSRLKPNKKRAARQAAEQYEDASLADLIKSLQPRQTDAAQLPAAAEEALTGPKAQTDAPSQLPAAQVSPQVSPQGETPAAAVLLPPIPVLTTQTDGIFVIDVKPQPPQTANTREPRPVSQPVSQPTSQPVPQPPAKATMSQRPGLPSGDEALEQQRRYFPSASDPSNMCLLCGREGHTADGCTNCACKFCGQDDHWQYACPSLDLRCDKCDIRGHSTAGCVTSIPRDYHFKCSFCHTANRHEDEHCTEPWRSFHPETETIKMVTALPVSCASCGSNHHFSANCNMDRVSDDPPNPTWSLYNMGRYIDATSSSSAIIGADECAPSQQSGELKIRGHASRTNEVRYYSDSDDSDDVQFLGRRVAPKPVRTGRIKVSASLQPPNGDQQPPLPPGPPPPEPPPPPPPPTNRAPRYSYSQALAGSNSLPARPPVPSRDYSSVPPPPSQPAQGSRQQSGRGGRGGSRGGGRGGGRGGRGGDSGGGGRSMAGYRGYAMNARKRGIGKGNMRYFHGVHTCGRHIGMQALAACFSVPAFEEQWCCTTEDAAGIPHIRSSSKHPTTQSAP